MEWTLDLLLLTEGAQPSTADLFVDSTESAANQHAAARYAITGSGLISSIAVGDNSQP